MADIISQLQELAAARDWQVNAFQSNHEGEIIDFIEDNRDTANALIINPGALMMNGWSLLDALEDFPAPWIEVHISNIWARERFRHHSVLSPLADGVIAGLGTRCYAMAATELMERCTDTLSL